MLPTEFINEVQKNGGIITDAIRAKYGLTKKGLQEAAKAAGEGAGTLKGKPDPFRDANTRDASIEIPADWEGQKWQTRVQLANQIDPANPIRTKDEADARIRAYLAAGNPEPEEEDQPLFGSDSHPATIEIGDEKIPLGEIVSAAHEESGLSVKEWNELPGEERDQLVQAEIDRRSDGGPEEE